MKKIAETFSKQYGVKFFYEDFRTGWQEGIDLSLELGLYRQNYCGCLFSEEERVSQIKKCIENANLFNVEVQVGDGLTVKYAKSIGAQAMIRGIRAVSDYEYELQIATANMKLEEEIETIFLIVRPAYSFLSSSVVKEIGENGGDISGFMPEVIVDEVLEELRKKDRQ